MLLFLESLKNLLYFWCILFSSVLEHLKWFVFVPLFINQGDGYYTFFFWSVYIIVMNRQISYVKTQYRNMRNKEDWYELVYERWKIYMITFKYYSIKETSKYIKCIGQLFVSDSQKVVKIWATALHLTKHGGTLIIIKNTKKRIQMTWKLTLRKRWFPIINLLFVTVNNCERIDFFIYRTKPAVWVTNNYKRTCTCTSGNSFSGTGFSSEDNVAILMI